MSSRPLRVVTTVWTALVALAAYAGAVGLATGSMSLGEEIDERLPFDSFVLAGLALLVFVALPTTVAALATWRQSGVGRPSARHRRLVMVLSMARLEASTPEPV